MLMAAQPALGRSCFRTAPRDRPRLAILILASTIPPIAGLLSLEDAHSAVSIAPPSKMMCGFSAMPTVLMARRLGRNLLQPERFPPHAGATPQLMTQSTIA